MEIEHNPQQLETELRKLQEKLFEIESRCNICQELTRPYDDDEEVKEEKEK